MTHFFFCLPECLCWIVTRISAKQLLGSVVQTRSPDRDIDRAARSILRLGRHDCRPTDSTPRSPSSGIPCGSSDCRESSRASDWLPCRPMFVDAARRHAVMYRLDHHPDANWPQRVMDCVGDLRCHFFLALEPLRERFDDAAQLRDPCDFVRR